MDACWPEWWRGQPHQQIQRLRGVIVSNGNGRLFLAVLVWVAMLAASLGYGGTG